MSYTTRSQSVAHLILADYARRLETANEELKKYFELSPAHMRLSTKISCYRTIISELEREIYVAKQFDTPEEIITSDKITESTTNSPLGSSHNINTLLARCLHIGEYLKKKSPSEEIIREWGNHLYESSRELFAALEKANLTTHAHIRLLTELMRFRGVMQKASDSLQYPDSFLKALSDAQALVNNESNSSITEDDVVSLESRIL